MRIKYAEVPKLNLLQKLITVSFNTPRKNLAVYKFCNSMKDKANYIENERKKIIQKYGEKDEERPFMVAVTPGTEAMRNFMDEFNTVLNMDVDEDITPLPLSEDDFENCVYSPEKEDWLNPKDIGIVLRFCE